MSTTVLAPGTGVCECGACRERFKSVTGFDRHRVGPGDARRCLSAEEMRAAGMSRNERGQWITAAYEVDDADTAA